MYTPYGQPLNLIFCTMNRLRFSRYFDGALWQRYFANSKALLLLSLALYAYLMYLTLSHGIETLWNGDLTPDPSSGDILFYSPLLLALEYILYYPVGKRLSRPVRIGPALIPWVILVLSCAFGIGFFKSMTVKLILLLAVDFGLVVAPMKGEGKNMEVIRSFVRVQISLLGTILIGLVLYGLTYLMALCLCYIFGQTPNDFVTAMACTLPVYLITPVTYRMMMDRLSENEPDKTLLHFVLNNLLLISFVIYVGILVLYIGRLAVTLSYPEGTIGWLMILFYLFGMVTLVGSYYVPTRNNIRLQRLFKWIMIPVIALALWAIAIRVKDYGWTRDRIYYVLGIVVMVISIVAWFLRKEKVYLISLSTGVALLCLFTIIPPISATGLGYRSQVNRTLEMARRLGVLREDGTTLIPSKELGVRFKERTEELKELASSMRYLQLNRPTYQKYITYPRFAEEEDLWVWISSIDNLTREPEEGTFSLNSREPIKIENPGRYSALYLQVDDSSTTRDEVVLTLENGSDKTVNVPISEFENALHRENLSTRQPLCISYEGYDIYVTAITLDKVRPYVSVVAVGEY